MATKKSVDPAAPMPRFDDPKLDKLKAKQAVRDKRQLAAELAKQLVKGNSLKGASLNELAESVISSFRGVRGIGARLRILYERAPPGSKQQLDVLKITTDLLKSLKDDESKTSASDLTDEEIESEIQAIILGMQEPDGGSPKTEEGKELLETVLLSEGQREYAALEREIMELDESHKIDELAADILEEANNDVMSENGVTPAIIPSQEDAADDETPGDDYLNVRYDD